jgi:hypothetical protein
VLDDSVAATSARITAIVPRRISTTTGIPASKPADYKGNFGLDCAACWGRP